MTTILAHDLEPGDVVDYPARCARSPRSIERAGWAWPVAYDDTGWAMALGHDLVAVIRTAR